MTLAEMLAHATELAPRDARLLLAHAAGVEPFRLSMIDGFDTDTEAQFIAMIKRRVAGEPVSHILGYREFYESRFIVTADVLDPRPETEELVRLALAEPFSTLLDLGAGSGAIGLSLLKARPNARGTLTDLSPAALNVVARNAAALEVESRCTLVQSDWFTNVTGRFDLIVSNPPYIAADEMPALQRELAHEPRMALTDEADGLTAYRVICAGAPEYLQPGGRLMVEIGPTQGQQVAQMMAESGLTQVQVMPDLDGRDRVVQGRKPA